MAKGAVSEGKAASLLDVVRDIIGGNLVLDENGDWWAGFRLRGVTYHLKDREGKQEIFEAIESALSTISTRVKILSLIRNFGGETYVEGLKSYNPNSHAWNEHCNFVAGRLRRRAPYNREFYLMVRLKQGPESLREVAETVVRFFRAAARRLFGVPLTFSVEDYLHARRVGQKMEIAFGPKLVANPLTPEDVQYLVKRGPYRAVGEPPIEEGWAPRRFATECGKGVTYYEPYTQDLVNLVGDVPWKADFGRLEFRHGDNVTSYQRFLCVSSMPVNDLGFPNSEWAFLDLPVDLCLDFDVVPHHTAERQRKDKSKKAQGQRRHTLDADADLDIGMRETEIANRELEALHAQGKPRLDCHVTIGVAATSPEELENRTQEVKQFYSGSELKIGVSTARSTQVECFADFLPVGPRRNGDYKQPMASKTLSGGMPVGNSSLGDGRGYYIGYPLQQPNAVVAYDPTLPMREVDAGGACAVVGDLGSGKTLLVQCLNAMFTLSGHQSLIVDPKGDSQKFKNMDELEGMIRWIRVEPDSPTRLPIMSVFSGESSKALKATEGLLRSFLLQLMEAQKNPDYAFAIRLGVRDFMRDDALRRRGIRGLVDQFAHNGSGRRADLSDDIVQTSKRAAADLRMWREDALVEIVLGDDAEDGEVLADENQHDPLTIIQTDGLDLPDRDKVVAGTLSDEQRIGQAILSIVAASAMRMASRHRYADEKPFKALTFDEAWRFLHNPEGQGLLNYLIREGRSQNVVPFVCTQKWEDVEPIIGLMPIRFMGRQQRDTDDIVRGLRMCGVDASPSNISSVKSFKAGDFMHQDVYGNVGLMHFDVTPAEWIVKLGSNPGPRQKVGAAPAAPFGADAEGHGRDAAGADAYEARSSRRRRVLRTPAG